MKKYSVIFLAVIGAIFLLLLALSGINLIVNQKKYFTKYSLEIHSLPLLKPIAESVEMQALKILKNELDEFGPFYVRKVKYSAGDSGLLFYGYDPKANSDTLLFTVVNNKNRNTNRRLRRLGSSDGIEESFDLNIVIDSEYYRIQMVNFAKNHETGGYLIEASLPIPGFVLKIDP